MEMTVTRFKATCLGVIDAVSKEKKRIIITRHGRPAAELIPFSDTSNQPLFGRARETTLIRGDLNGTGESWQADA